MPACRPMLSQIFTEAVGTQPVPAGRCQTLCASMLTAYSPAGVPLLFSSDSQPGLLLCRTRCLRVCPAHQVEFVVGLRSPPGSAAASTDHARKRCYANNNHSAHTESHLGSGPDFLPGCWSPSASKCCPNRHFGTLSAAHRAACDMRLSQCLALFNRCATNLILRNWAGYSPRFDILEQAARQSGRCT